MYHFWEIVIKDIFDIIEPKHIVEIGSDTGLNFINLINYEFKQNTHISVIDPAFNYNIEYYEANYENISFYKDSSLNILPHLNNIDVVLIDGDHNWYTVYNELCAIYNNTVDQNNYLPIIFLHDTGWPYGRRDMYYNPENIPFDYRIQYNKKGMKPGFSKLFSSEGVNKKYNNAIYEGGYKNGVLTAVEDFINAYAEVPLFITNIIGLHGLSIICDQRIVDNNLKLKKIFEEFNFTDRSSNLIKKLEDQRIDKSVEFANLYRENLQLRDKINEYEKRINRMQFYMQCVRDKIKD